MFGSIKNSREAMLGNFRTRFENPQTVGDIALFASQSMRDRWYFGGQIVAAKRMTFAGESWITIGFAGTQNNPGASIYLYPATDLVLVKSNKTLHESPENHNPVFSRQGWQTVNSAYPYRSPGISERERAGNVLAREAFGDWLRFSRDCLSYTLTNNPEGNLLSTTGVSIRSSGIIEGPQPPRTPLDQEQVLAESFDKAMAKSAEVEASEKAIKEYFDQVEATFHLLRDATKAEDDGQPAL